MLRPGGVSLPGGKESRMSFIDCCDWEKCTLCGDCLVECPVMEMTRAEAVSEFERLLKGEFAPRVMSECTLCFNCNNYCPEGLRPYELILQRVSERDDRKARLPALIPYALNGMPPPTFFQDLYQKLDYSEKVILSRWSAPPPPSKEILFVGCLGKTFCYDIENSSVMESLPKFGPTDVCCGELHYRSGMWDAYQQNAERTLARFAELDIERMVCYCGSCYNFLGHILPDIYGRKLPFELVSLYEWLLERVVSGELEVKRPLGFKAAVHESCYVSELGTGFYDALRNIYEAAGAELVELEHNRDRGLSCGAASVCLRFNPLDVLKHQHRKYREVLDTGAREMALNCPGCYFTLYGTSRLYGIKLRYMVEELLYAFGDDISIPASRRFPLIARSVSRRLPLALKRVPADLPRIHPGTAPRT